MIFFTSIAIDLLDNIAKPISLNSVYKVSFQHDIGQVIQPLYSLVVKIILLYLTGRLGYTSYKAQYIIKIYIKINGEDIYKK